MARKIGQIVGRGPRTWLIRVYNGRDPETRRRKDLSQTIHGGLRDAQAHLNKMLGERDCGRNLDSSKQTLSQYLDRWLEVCAKILRHVCDLAWADLPGQSASGRSIARIDIRFDTTGTTARSCAQPVDIAHGYSGNQRVRADWLDHSFDVFLPPAILSRVRATSVGAHSRTHCHRAKRKTGESKQSYG